MTMEDLGPSSLVTPRRGASEEVGFYRSVFALI
jgi:hypothetical protein